MAIYRSVDGINRSVKEIYIPVSGVNRKVKSEYSPLGGINRIVYKYMVRSLGNITEGYNGYTLDSTKIITDINLKTITTNVDSITDKIVCNGFRVDNVEISETSNLNVRIDTTTSNGLKVWSGFYILDSNNSIIKQQIVTSSVSNATIAIDVSSLNGIYTIILLLAKDIDASNQYSGSLTIHDVSLDTHLIIE